jgi:hypothetical protein
MTEGPTELSVRSESVQRLYSLYLEDHFRVNRRYQRKLVWTVEEKQRLIDSLAKDLPIPLFLVAEGASGDSSYELIDGMQRLDAIFSFLENEFPYNGHYFDLDALADTKLRHDTGELQQHHPKMERADSVALANYSVALSVFRASSSLSVDEVFRRINSGGRRLSRQALRQAGTTSTLADLVRVISSRIRGDTSPGDLVPLRAMAKLSISNRDLDYGVQVDDIFWVKEGILRREDVRESYDEQVVLDLLADCLLDPLPNTGSRLRDEYYSYTELGSEDEITEAATGINIAIDTYGREQLEADFFRVYDEIRSALRQRDLRFSSLIGLTGGGRAPRYFHVVFMAIYDLINGSRMRVKDYPLLASRLEGMAEGPLQIPGGGGDWRKDAKRQSIDAVKGVLREAFEEAPEGEDLGRYGRASLLETLLGNAIVEQQSFDCKQGFLSLSDERTFDEESFTKICRTLTAMANGGPGQVGYIAVGIADDVDDAERVAELDGVQALTYRGFFIVGVEREAALVGQSLNNYWSSLVQRLKNGLPDEIKSSVGSESRFVNYNSLPVALLKVEGGQRPVFFENELWVREGSDTVKVGQDRYHEVFARFPAPNTGV